jgi:hypothetical protein
MSKTLNRKGREGFAKSAKKNKAGAEAAFLCVLGVYFLGELCGQKLLNVENL